ncbi:MAG: hypothetical protein EOP51_04955 [Sphingobacteriales bacterium]|nr:MAG: hypothetical protein EOP51_04955 [Sphingobacteriales bacterium]
MKFLFTAICLLFATAIFAQSAPEATIPFTVEKSCIYFYCKVNETDSLKFLFDTGADGSVINMQSAGKVNLKIDGEGLNIGSNGSNTVSTSSNNIISVGNIKQEHVPLTLIPYETTAFDGVWGTDLMRNYVIEIDYHKKELRFYKAQQYKADLTAYDKCKLYFPGNYFSIKASIVINGKVHKGIFGLDSGADNVLTLASPFAASSDVLNKLTKIGSSTSQGSDGSTYESPIVQLPEVVFGGKHFYNIITDVSASTAGGDAVTDKSGFFGNDFLKRFNTVIDFPNGYIYFKPNNLLYSKFFAE